MQTPPATAPPGAPIEPAIVLEIAERVVADGAARGGTTRADLGPAEARSLLRALARLDRPRAPTRRELIALMQEDDFSHADLARRARRIHERRMRRAVSR